MSDKRIKRGNWFANIVVSLALILIAWLAFTFYNTISEFNQAKSLNSADIETEETQPEAGVGENITVQP